MKLALQWLCLFFLTSISLKAQNASDSLTVQLQEIVAQSNIPGFGVAVVSKGKVLYTKGFGYADVEANTPYTAQTIHNIGSTTKTLIAAALMKLVEEGKVTLDDPIGIYLPFTIEHPSFPETSITLRQLATHTSSLTDGADDMIIEKTYLFDGAIDFKKEELPEDYDTYFKIYRNNNTMSMKKFLYHAYHKNGDWYAPENFLDTAPGTTYQYTNLGATLLAYIIERVSGMAFSEYTQQHILTPLGMQDSYWSAAATPKTQLASLYLSNGLKIPSYNLITYPDGGLYTSVSDFALYLKDMIQGLNGEGILLAPASYQAMMQNQLTEEHFPNGTFESTKGLLWSVNPEGDNISANGADPGIMTYTLFTTAGNLGIVIFMNTSLYGDESMESDFNNIRNALFQNASALRKESK